VSGLGLNPFASRPRPALAGQLGAVSAAHPLAAAAGQEVLAAGGGAVDAVIAAQAVLCATSPQACGIGGDAFYLVREPGGAVVAVNGAGAAARRQTRPASDGGLSVTVPGLVSAWDVLSSRWARLPLSRNLQPAIRLARSGTRVDADLAGAVAAQRARLVAGGAQSWPLLARAAGDSWAQPELAATLEAIAKSGRAAIYTGRIGAAMVAAVQASGGALQLDDLAAHGTEVRLPIAVSWCGHEVAVQPPVSQGVLLAVVLAGLEKLGPLPAERLDHAAIELTEAAFAFRDRVGDGEALLSEALPIDLDRASGRGGPRAYLHTAGVAAADRNGVVVASLASVFDDFGSGVFVPEAGFLLNNRGGGFTAAPNDFAPGKRPVHTLAPALVQRGDLCLAFATPGADGQVQALLQVLLAWQVGGRMLAEAIDAPRWRSEDGSLLVEAGHPHRDALRRLGHRIVDTRAGDMRFGAVTAAGVDGPTPFALPDWRRTTWAGVA